MWRGILQFYTRSMALWVVLMGLAAYRWPGPFVALTPYNKAFFALTMFGIGVALHRRDFARILRQPWIVLLGSAAQFTVMPLGAFALARIFHLPSVMAAGLVLTGAAPGAMASNVMCYVARADTAYSVSLTTVSTLLCPLLTPGLTKLLAGSLLPIPFWAMVADVMVMVIVPLLLGFGVRALFPRPVERVLPVFPALSVTFIVFVCSLVIARNRDRLGQASVTLLLTGVLLNVYGLASGYGIASLFRLETPRRRTLAIEIGMQNAGLGASLALVHLGDEAALPAALFVFVCIITAAVLTNLWQRRPTTAS